MRSGRKGPGPAGRVCKGRQSLGGLARTARRGRCRRPSASPRGLLPGPDGPRAPVALSRCLVSLALVPPACMEQESGRHGKGQPMQDDAGLTQLFSVLDTLSEIAQAMDPRRLDALITRVADQDLTIGGDGPLAMAAAFAAQACAGLRAAPAAENPMIQAYRAMRYNNRALETLAGLTETVPAVGRYFLEPSMRDDP